MINFIIAGIIFFIVNGFTAYAARKLFYAEIIRMYVLFLIIAFVLFVILIIAFLPGELK